MNRTSIAAAALAALFLICAAAPVRAWNRGHAEIFAVLPDGSTGPEGLTVGADGNVYVATFGFNSQGPVGGLGQLFVFNPSGRLLRQVAIAGSSSHLLGLAFHPMTGALLVIDFGNKQVLKVNPVTGLSSVFMTVSGPAGLNGLTFDKAGNVYVTDSFQGIVWKTGAGGGAGTPWLSDPLLAPSLAPGENLSPPFGANGAEFNNEGTTMFVTNTAYHFIVRIPLKNDGTAGTPQIFVTGINAPDGLAIDRDDNLWICANQQDEILVVDPSGKVIAKRGDFEGVDEDGVPHGLLFPASPAFSLDGKFLYVSDLALDLRVFNLPEAVDSQWTAQVRRYTVSKISARIPPLPDGDNENQQ